MSRNSLAYGTFYLGLLNVLTKSEKPHCLHVAGELSEEAFRNLLRTTTAIRSKMEEHFGEFGLSGSQWGVLRVIHRAALAGEQGVRLTDLVGRMLVTPPAITGVVSRLERARMVRRTVSKGDRRARVVRLTPAGRRLVERVLKSHRNRIHAVMAGLNSEEVQLLDGLLVRLGSYVHAMSKGFSL